jgi:Fic family protein
MRSNKLFSIALAVAGSVFVVAFASASEIHLAVRGKAPSFTIVTGEKPPPSVKFAASELRDYVKKITDVELPVAERVAGGRMVARFVPTSAAATPGAVERICKEYSRWSKDGTYDPLLVSLVFVFDLVCIHPFSDGNGRMSRLLTLLLTYRSGYDVGKYVSIEAEIERTKATYYEALAASSAGWAKGESDYAPFVTYMLGVMAACYADLDARVALLASGGKGEDILRAYFADLVGTATKRRILDDNPTLSRRTVERVLQKLQSEGIIEKVGAARATTYRRVER